jgi:hypothetical protein
MHQHAVDEKLNAMGIAMRQVQNPTANYVLCQRSSGNLLHLAGHNPQQENDELLTGKLGQDYTVEQGYEAARWCAINILYTLVAPVRKRRLVASQANCQGSGIRELHQ